jgi:hypothetical protein
MLPAIIHDLPKLSTESIFGRQVAFLHLRTSFLQLYFENRSKMKKTSPPINKLLDLLQEHRYRTHVCAC